MTSKNVTKEQLGKWRKEFEAEIHRQDMLEDEHGEYYRFEFDEDDTYHDKALEFMWKGYLMRCQSLPKLKLVKR